MSTKWYDTKIKDFIKGHLKDDPFQLTLRYSGKTGLPYSRGIEQIRSRQKAKNKLPNWYQNLDLIFPPAISVEQGSSQITAELKASMIKGKNLIDATGGMGVDTYYLSKSFNQTFYVEQNEELCELAKHNFKTLGAPITVVNNDIKSFFETSPLIVDVIYIDPARRGDNNQRLVQIADCQPDLIQLQPLLLSKCNTILAKFSPMIDIKDAINRIEGVHKVTVVAVQNEVKEVLLTISGISKEPAIDTINISSNAVEKFSFSYEDEQKANVQLSDPQNYLHEPNTAILKAGAFKAIAKHFTIQKLHPHSHLYTSEHLVNSFPGRKFKVVGILKPDKNAIATNIPSLKANLTVRNYPESVDTLRKRWKLKEGGEDYLFATTLQGKRHVIIHCRRIT